MKASLLHWPVASLRTYLVAAILIATLPTVGVLAALQIESNLETRAQQRYALVQSAQSAATHIAREIGSSTAALRLLSTMAADGDPEAVIARLNASDASSLPSSWSGVFALSKDGRLYKGSAQPAGFSDTSVVPSKPDNARDLPWISDLIRFGDRSWTAVAVPVRSANRDPYLIGAWIDASAWADLLIAHGTAGLYVRLVDGQGQLIASGRPWLAPPDLPTQTVLPPDKGVLQAGWERPSTVHAEGQALASQPTHVGGWSVVMDSPDVRTANQGAAVVAPLAGALGCLLIGVLLALYVARRVTIPLHHLALEGVDAPSVRIVVREIALLREALQAARAQDESARRLVQTKAEEFQTLFESSPIGLAFAQDAQCRAVLHNAAMDASFGPAEENGTHVQVLHAGVALEPGQQPLQRAASHGEITTSLELELVGGSGPARHVLASAVPLLDSTGAPRGAIGAVVDITDRKLSEARLLSIDKRLRESQRLVDLAQQAGHVGFFYYQFEQDVLGWTPGQAKLFDIDTTSTAGASLDVWAQRINSATRADIRQALERMVANQDTVATLDFEIDLPSSSSRWLSNRLMLNYGASGEPVQLVGISLDVTDQKRAERERDVLMEREQTARLEAEAANRAKDEFLGMLGHELRNPLSAISSAVEVLERVDPGSDVANNAQTIIARQARNLARLLDDLLDVGRVISGKIALSKQSLDLAALVQRLVTTLQLTGTSARHTIEVETSPGWMEGDAMRLEQIVSNLLANAVKYTPEGGRISVAVRRDGDAVQLEVRDTGPGIPETLLPRIFDLFVQGQRSLDRRAGGLGIGLTLVQRLVQLHGGRVCAESSPQGSVFRVFFPAAEAPARRHLQSAQHRAKKRRVLVVEDNADARLAMQAILALMGHSVEVASDGFSGLEAVLASRPDIAIVDIGLPELTGLEVAKRARGGGYAGRLIAVSGYGQPADVRQAMLAGFDAYLVKPVSASELEQRMEDDAD